MKVPPYEDFLVNRNGGAMCGIHRDEQEEQDEDDQKDDSPTCITAKYAFHKNAPFFVEMDVTLYKMHERYRW